MKAKRKTKSKPTTPTPATISGPDLAAVSGYSERHLRDLARAGYFPSPKRAVYELLPAVKGLFRHEREKKSEARDSERLERSAYWRAKRLATEQAMRLQSGELVPVKQVASDLSILLDNQRHFILHQTPLNLPSKILAVITSDRSQSFQAVRELLIENACQFFKFMRESDLWKQVNPTQTYEAKNKTTTPNQTPAKPTTAQS